MSQHVIERVHAFDRDGNVVRSGDRIQLNQEIRQHSKQHGDAHIALECIYLMLVNAANALYIVQRAAKSENPWLWDKTVGGGVLAGDTADQTVVREAAEELGICAVLVSAAAYAQRVAEADLRTQAIVRQIGFDPWFRSKRIAPDGEHWLKRARVTLYAGRYDGPVRFADGEANAMRLMTLEELRSDLDSRPAAFTSDLREIVERFGAELLT